MGISGKKYSFISYLNFSHPEPDLRYFMDDNMETPGKRVTNLP